MIEQLVIALAKRSVPFACFGLSRVHFVGYRVPFSLAQTREGMFGDASQKVVRVTYSFMKSRPYDMRNDVT